MPIAPTAVTLRAYLNPEACSLDMYFYSVDRESGERVLASPVVFEGRNAKTYPSPTIRIDDQYAQQIMDALWSTGLRPRDVGTAGQLGATERHLEDMRKLVFDRLEGKHE